MGVWERMNIQTHPEKEIDVLKLMKAVFRKFWVIAAAAVGGAVLAILITLFFITPQYQSSVMFYVNNNSVSLGETAASITSADISASRGLVDSFLVILKARETLTDVIDYAGVDLPYTELSEMLTAEAVNDTEFFRVVATSPDPQEAEKIANAVAYILPKRISSIIEGTSAKIVDSAVLATRPSAPNYVSNSILGFLLGFAAATGVIVLRVLMDVTIRSEEDILQTCSYPILASVPDMESAGKSGYSYENGKTRKKQVSPVGGKAVLTGGDISFAAAEAYKLLRTKLQFSFADDQKSHIIAVSSAVSGEGKSLSAINLAYSLSQLGKSVILIDCDMRRPTLAEKLNLRKMPGLSNFLAGQNKLQDVVQCCGISNDETAFRVITAGQKPPNPIELLSSERMTKVLKGMRQICDYIILDLPPVGEVSDALAVARETDGILLVVRQNCCTSADLSATIRQLAYVNAKLLGIVYNCTTEGGKKYGDAKRYRNYYGKKSEKDTKRKRASQTKKRHSGVQ